MRIAVISDIHGNLSAFQKVLEDLEAEGIDTIVCLGDNIGYGPEPEEVVREVRKRKIPCVKGNHEKAITRDDYLNWFNPVARESLTITMAMLSSDSIDYMRKMPLSLVRYGSRFVHGYPPDLIDTYLFEASQNILTATLRELKESICFVGHTHELTMVAFDGVSCEHRPLPQNDVLPLQKENKYIVNTGSVGQPRDGNNNAKYVIWDATENTLRARYVPYDIATVARKIIATGLPKVHADRLW